MEVLLSAMLVRRTERADGSTQAVGAQVGVGAACRKEFVAKRQRLKDRATEQTPSSIASAVSRRSGGQGVATISCSEPDRQMLGLPCRCPPWRAKRRMLADVFHWRQIRSAARRIMRVHRNVGKKAMIVYLQLAVENGARRLCQKHFVQGRYRTTAIAVERVCCKASAVCSIGVGADTVGAQRVRCREGVEASDCDTLLFRYPTGRLADVLSA